MRRCRRRRALLLHRRESVRVLLDAAPAAVRGVTSEAGGWKGSIAVTASGTCSGGRGLWPGEPAHRDDLQLVAEDRGLGGEPCANACLDWPGTMSSGLAGPVPSRTGVKSMTTVTHLSPGGCGATSQIDPAEGPDDILPGRPTGKPDQVSPIRAADPSSSGVSSVGSDRARRIARPRRCRRARGRVRWRGCWEGRAHADSMSATPRSGVGSSSGRELFRSPVVVCAA